MRPQRETLGGRGGGGGCSWESESGEGWSAWPPSPEEESWGGCIEGRVRVRGGRGGLVSWTSFPKERWLAQRTVDGDAALRIAKPKGGGGG